MSEGPSPSSSSSSYMSEEPSPSSSASPNFTPSQPVVNVPQMPAETLSVLQRSLNHLADHLDNQLTFSRSTGIRVPLTNKLNAATVAAYKKWIKLMWMAQRISHNARSPLVGTTEVNTGDARGYIPLLSSSIMDLSEGSFDKFYAGDSSIAVARFSSKMLNQMADSLPNSRGYAPKGASVDDMDRLEAAYDTLQDSGWTTGKDYRGRTVTPSVPLLGSPPNTVAQIIGPNKQIRYV